MGAVLTSAWGRRLVLAVLGAVAGLGQAPTDLWFVTVLAVAAVFTLYRPSDKASAAFAAGWWSGLGYFAVSLRWIVEPFLVDAATYGWMAPFAIVLMAGGAALFWGLACFAAHRISPRSALVFVAAMASAEIGRSLIFTGFPWALLGHIWIATPISQLAAFIGPHGLTLITLLVAVSLAQIVARNWVWAAVPVLLAVAFVGIKPAETPYAVDAPTVRIVQPNIPQNEKWAVDKRAQNFSRLLGLTSTPSEGLDLIVWPETALADLLEFAGPSIDTISDIAGPVPLVTGVQRRAEHNIYHNSLALIEQGAEISATYDKKHLVPFGEYVPGGEIAARLGLRGFASSQGFGFTAGSGEDLLEIPGIGLTRPLICYEGIFSEEIGSVEGRPRFLMLITNDAWFGKGAGPEQHLAQARLRSIERGLPMIRAANTGISAVIDPHGTVLKALPLDEAGIIDAPLPAALPATIYVMTGDYPAFIAILMLLCLGFYSGPREDD